jgi:hypothetical protein
VSAADAPTPNASSTEADLVAGMNVSSGWVEPKRSGVGVISGAVTNRNEIAVRSINVRCAGYLNSGRSIERDFMIWSVIEPGASAPFNTDIEGFSDRAVAKCWVVDLRTLTEIRCACSVRPASNHSRPPRGGSVRRPCAQEQP